MEGLRHSLLAPTGATVVIVVGTLDTMVTFVKTKLSAKDDNGKLLFSIPFAPWTQVDPKYEEQSGKVLRAYRAIENVKEWAFVSLPLMWSFALHAGSIPKVTTTMVDVAIIGSAIIYAVGNRLFAKGYIESPAKRMTGFKIRTNVVIFWLGGSVVSFLCSASQKYDLL